MYEKERVLKSEGRGGEYVWEKYSNTSLHDSLRKFQHTWHLKNVYLIHLTAFWRFNRHFNDKHLLLTTVWVHACKTDLTWIKNQVGHDCLLQNCVKAESATRERETIKSLSSKAFTRTCTHIHTAEELSLELVRRHLLRRQKNRWARGRNLIPLSFACAELSESCHGASNAEERVDFPSSNWPWTESEKSSPF